MPAAFHQLDEILGHWLCAVNHEALSLSDEEEEYDDEDGDDSDDSVVSFFLQILLLYQGSVSLCLFRRRLVLNELRVSECVCVCVQLHMCVCVCVFGS